MEFSGNLGLSLVSQYQASKFSYCIGNISDRSYAYNTLVIGNSIELWGVQTPLIVEDKNYINLEGIKIGDFSLEFDPQIFIRNSSEYTGGMMVDTGSSLSFIPGVVLSDFETTVKNLIDYELDLDLDPDYSNKYKEHTRLCYHGVVSIDLIGFPLVKLQFQDNAVMELRAENIFQQTRDEIFCLAILPSELLGTTVSILGNVMQQNFYVGYDLLEKKLSFQRMVCKAVDEYYHDEL
ncbi:aspartic proteinase nepenthesin-1 [Phtheirospermum japonicum]|uniref:Aspartic proteinase nepenthesin-1 n=1 Tax=Phtheirospermum japonicum TaxID=374723 RepID=A0A830D9L7_9LAMI|nr:aspartic proteinase nepenthesin-1 [Phtheirospermum japonicum]